MGTVNNTRLYTMYVEPNQRVIEGEAKRLCHEWNIQFCTWEDIAQEAALKAYLNIDKFTFPTGMFDVEERRKVVAGWLRRIVYTTVADMVRERGRRVQTSAMPEWLDGVTPSVGDYTFDEVELHDYVNRIVVFLADECGLTREQQLAVGLMLVDGLTVREAAGTVGVSVSSAHRACVKARQVASDVFPLVA